jgi:hypothetical protein
MNLQLTHKPRLLIMRQIFVLLAFLTLSSCISVRCDDIVTYEEQWPTYTYINGEYIFLDYRYSVEIMDRCDCNTKKQWRRSDYYRSLEWMSAQERDFHYHYKTYFRCK